MQSFDFHAPGAEHKQRPERRVSCHADNDFLARRDHLLNEQSGIRSPESRVVAALAIDLGKVIESGQFAPANFKFTAHE